MINLIENTEQLSNLCKILENQPFITIDTEFIREKTYYPQLCLLQVGCPETAAVIDPLAAEIDLSVFYKLLANEKIVKVFHSGRQDIEIFHHLAGFIPAPLFDTQIAAAACGFGEASSYETLVNKITLREIDKTCRYTNWSSRPLDKKQLEYALGDVTHLVDIYLYLKDYLEKNNRTDWIKEETELLCNPKLYECPPEEAWLRVKHHSRNPKFLTLLKELAAWREQRAQEHDVPRQLILRDECLQSIAASWPCSVSELEKIRNIRKDIPAGKLGEEILEVIDKVKTMPAADYICEDTGSYRSRGNTSLLQELLRLLLKIKSQQHEVAPRLIASEDELHDFAAGHDEVAFIRGWRNGVFGQDACRLRAGDLGFRYDPASRGILLLPAQNNDGSNS